MNSQPFPANSRCRGKWSLAGWRPLLFGKTATAKTRRLFLFAFSWGDERHNYFFKTLPSPSFILPNRSRTISASHQIPPPPQVQSLNMPSQAEFKYKRSAPNMPKNKDNKKAVTHFLSLSPACARTTLNQASRSWS